MEPKTPHVNLNLNLDLFVLQSTTRGRPTWSNPSTDRSCLLCVSYCVSSMRDAWWTQSPSSTNFNLLQWPGKTFRETMMMIMTQGYYIWVGSFIYINQRFGVHTAHSIPVGGMTSGSTAMSLLVFYQGWASGISRDERGLLSHPETQGLRTGVKEWREKDVDRSVVRPGFGHGHPGTLCNSSRIQTTTEIYFWN